MDEVKPLAALPTVEHREPCESRGSRTVLGAPGGEIPPGDSPVSYLKRCPRLGRERGHSGHGANTAHGLRFAEHAFDSQFYARRNVAFAALTPMLCIETLSVRASLYERSNGHLAWAKGSLRARR